MKSTAARSLAAQAHSLVAVFLFVLSFPSGGLHAAAETSGVITGRVTNGATGDVLPSAVVSVEGSGATTSTDTNGAVMFSLPEWAHHIVV